MCSEFGLGQQQLARRFKLLGFVVRQICPEAATVHGMGTVYVPNAGGEIPADVTWREEVAGGADHDSFVFNLELVSGSS